MRLYFDKTLASNYQSPSQISKILSESWVGKEAYCPSCGKNLAKYPNNRPVADYYCLTCGEDFELKSKRNKFGRIINDGAYDNAVERTLSSTNPNLFLLSYDITNLAVKDFIVVPKYFFTPQIIAKRKPLSSSARRAGWIGCNFLFDRIPQTGRIFI